MVFPLEHLARIWCQSSLNWSKDAGFQKLGLPPSQKNIRWKTLYVCISVGSVENYIPGTCPLQRTFYNGVYSFGFNVFNS
jgi:hypothetical protein